MHPFAIQSNTAERQYYAVAIERLKTFIEAQMKRGSPEEAKNVQSMLLAVAFDTSRMFLGEHVFKALIEALIGEELPGTIDDLYDRGEAVVSIHRAHTALEALCWDGFLDLLNEILLPESFSTAHQDCIRAYLRAITQDGGALDLDKGSVSLSIEKAVKDANDALPKPMTKTEQESYIKDLMEGNTDEGESNITIQHAYDTFKRWVPRLIHHEGRPHEDGEQC